MKLESATFLRLRRLTPVLDDVLGAGEVEHAEQALGPASLSQLCSLLFEAYRWQHPDEIAQVQLDALEPLAHFDREVIPERRMHAKGSGAFGTFTVTHDITRYTRAKIFSQVGKKTDLFVRVSTVAGERGAADADRDIRGFAVKFYTEEGNWDLVGNNTPIFFLRDPLKFPDLNHSIKRDPRTDFMEPPLSLEGAADRWNHRRMTTSIRSPAPCSG